VSASEIAQPVTMGRAAARCLHRYLASIFTSLKRVPSFCSLPAAIKPFDRAWYTPRRRQVLIEAVRGGRRRRATILNTRADYDKLVTTLRAMQMPVVVGLEPAGNYHRVLAHRLIDAGFTVRLIASMALARTRETLHNRWDKNDPKDAQVILHMLGIGATMVYQDPLAAGISDLQELSKTHEVVSKPRPSSGTDY